MPASASISVLASRPIRDADYVAADATSCLATEQVRQLLPALVGRLCLEVYDREWMSELPYELWEAMTNSEDDKVPRFHGKDLALLRTLSRAADGWVRHEGSTGLVFVSRANWLRAYAGWKRSRGTRLAPPRCKVCEIPTGAPNG